MKQPIDSTTPAAPENPQPAVGGRPSTPCSSSEFACQYWRDEKGWSEASIHESMAEAIRSHERITAMFANSRRRVIERIITERVICETNAQAKLAPDSEPPHDA